MARVKMNSQSDFSDDKGPTIAAFLHTRRVQSGQDLHDIAQELRIRYQYLLAIEDGRFHTLPGATYASGFVRTYAEYLGLDGNDVVRRFKAETKDLEHRAILAFPSFIIDEHVPTTSMVFGSIMLISVVYGIWLWLSSEEMVTEVIPPVPEHLISLAHDTTLQTTEPIKGLPSTTTIPSGSLEGSEHTTNSHASLSRSTQQWSGTSGEAIYSVTETGTEVVETVDNASITRDASILISPQLTEHRMFGKKGNSSRVRLYANDDSLIQVKDGKNVLLRRILHKGEGYYVPNRSGLSLVVSNAGAVFAWVDGIMGPPLGLVREKRLGISLDPDKLKAEAINKKNQIDFLSSKREE